MGEIYDNNGDDDDDVVDDGGDGTGTRAPPTRIIYTVHHRVHPARGVILFARIIPGGDPVPRSSSLNSSRNGSPRILDVRWFVSKLGGWSRGVEGKGEGKNFRDR